MRTHESDEGAPELTSWEQCIARVEVADDSNPELLRIKTAAQALQNQAGRVKKDWLRTNAKNWGVQRQQRAEGTLRDKPTDQLEQELRTAIREALNKWLAHRSPQAAAEISSSSTGGRSAIRGALNKWIVHI